MAILRNGRGDLNTGFTADIEQNERFIGRLVVSYAEQGIQRITVRNFNGEIVHDERNAQNKGLDYLIHLGKTVFAPETAPSTIPDSLAGKVSLEDAAHVLWNFNQGGYEPGSFTRKLLDAWGSADYVNSARLAEAFPGLGAAIEISQRPGGIERLKEFLQRGYTNE